MRQNSSVFCPSAIVCRREENQSDRHQEHVCLSKGTQPYRVLLSLTMKTISPSYLLDAGTVLFVRLYGNTTWVMCWSRTVVLLSRPRMRHSLLSFIRRAPTCVASRLVVQQSRRLLHRNAMLASLCYEKYAAFASRRGVCGTERVGSVWLDCGNPASIALCRRYARLVSRTAVGMGWARICISRGCELRLSTTHEGLGQA